MRVYVFLITMATFSDCLSEKTTIMGAESLSDAFKMAIDKYSERAVRKVELLDTYKV